jgi:hypothetical protein
MNRLLPTLFCIFLLVFNWIIYSSTNQKINLYKHIPPFPSYDFTSSKDNIFNLKDGDHTTYWRKGKDGVEWDIDLELRFSHQLKSNIYIPISYRELSIIPCEGYPPVSLIIELFKREGINVDKELRMPSDFLIEKIIITDIKSPYLYDISRHFKDQEELKTYDGNKMFILGVKSRLMSESGSPCLAEIELKE